MADKVDHTEPTTDVQDVNGQADNVVEDELYELTVKLPGNAGSIKLTTTPREAITDLKQSIMESPETCTHSCFSLAFNGQRLNDFMELAEIEGITTESELELVEDPYTERDVRLHINRLRDLLAGPYKADPSAVGIDAGLSFLTAVTGEIDEEIIPEEERKPEDPFSDEPAPEHAFTNVDLQAKSKLSEFVPNNFRRDPPVCLKSIALSGWNAPPHARRLKGDLLYLKIVTLENETLHITASPKGFFINSSTDAHYDPAPRASKRLSAHSLIALLQLASSQFAQRFKELQDFITQHHMLEVLPVNTYFPAHPWAVHPPKHTYDPSRPCEPFLNFGSDAVEGMRDWNDELQSNRELPRTNLQERVLRERLINKVQSEFTEAAVRGAMAVVNGSVVPLNPLEPADSHMYVYNNIFFSKGNDGRGTFESLGADEAAHVATGKDLEGVKVFNNIDAEGVYTLGSVIVDYKGVRIVAQSIVPGIFRRQDENSIVYGSVDNGDHVVADSEFHTTVGNEIAKSLHLAEHAVLDGENKEHTLFTSQETKGLTGADGRRYLLDLYRINPVDIVFQEEECVAKDGMEAYPHKMTLLRPELMSLYWEHKLREWVKAKTEQIRQEKKAANGGEDKKEIEAKPVPKEDEKKEADGQEVAKEGQEEERKPEEEEEEIKIDVSEFKLLFNPDVFTSAKHANDEELKADEETVRNASKFLNDEIIPTLVLNFASYAISPLDGDALTKAMHRRGINMRYLGKLARLVAVNQDKRIEHIRLLAIQEMIVRASKRILRDLLSDCALEETSACIAHFFNCLFGAALNPKPKPVVPENKSRNDLRWARLTPASVLAEVKSQVAKRFRHTLEEDFMSQVKTLPTLREICLRVGIQLEIRDYHFDAYNDEERAAMAAEEAQLQSQAAQQNKAKQAKRNNKKRQQPLAEERKATWRKTTFIPEDVLNVMPTVKQAGGRSLFAEETFEAGKLSLTQNHDQLGLELLLESMTLHEQTYGYLHPETSKCYATLAMIYHEKGQREFALDLQRKAVIAAERTCGVDHPETIHHYLNLGLFEYAAGRTKLALRYLKHALYYWGLLFGVGHPDSATADNNTGVMLQSLRDYKTSTLFFERACETQENIFGKEHAFTATGYHILAKAYTLQGDFKKALEAERVAFDVFSKELGADHPKTKEAEMWRNELAANADLTEKRVQEQAKMNPAHLAGRTMVTSPSQATAAAVAGQRQQQQHPSEMSIDAVLEYINSPSPAGKSSRKTKKKNTKH